jgi:hypothetical protein
VTNAPSRATLSGHVKESEPTLCDLGMRGDIIKTSTAFSPSAVRIAASPTHDRSGPAEFIDHRAPRRHRAA